MVRIKGWKKTGRKSWKLTSPKGTVVRLTITKNTAKGFRGEFFAYTVTVYSGTFKQKHHEDTAKEAQQRAIKIQKEISRRYFK